MVRYRNKRHSSDFVKRLIAIWTVLSMLLSNFATLAENTPEGSDIQTAAEDAGWHEHTEACYENILVCGQEEAESEREFQSTFAVHHHSGSCYDAAGNLSCGLIENEYYHTHNEFCRNAEGQLVCGLETRRPHEHTEDCYRTDRSLVCEKQETEGHAHNDACYRENRELVCGIEESEGHTHGEECYVEQKELTCDLDENEDHIHDDSCYTVTRKLVCEKEEKTGHAHSDDCWRVTRELVCEKPEQEPHFHGDSCYEETKTLICEKPTTTHHHTASCFNEQGLATCGQWEVPTFTCTEENWVEVGGHHHDESCYEKKLVCGQESEDHQVDGGDPVSADQTNPEDDLVAAKEDSDQTTDSTADASSDTDQQTDQSADGQQPEYDINIPDRQDNDTPAATVGSGTESPAEPENSNENLIPEFEINDTVLSKYYGSDEIVTVPDGITQIDVRAFNGNTAIRKVILPDSVELINSSAFADCHNLEQVVLSDQSKLSLIGMAAFKNDKKLDTSFAANVAHVVENAFVGIGDEEEPGKEKGSTGTDTGDSEKSIGQEEFEVSEGQEETDNQEESKDPEDQKGTEESEEPEDLNTSEEQKEPEDSEDNSEQKDSEDSEESNEQKKPEDLEKPDEKKEYEDLEASKEQEDPEAFGEQEDSEDTVEHDESERTIAVADDAPIQAYITFSSEAGIPEGTQFVVEESAENANIEPQGQPVKLKSASRKAVLQKSRGAEDPSETYASVPSLTVLTEGEAMPDIVLYDKTLNISLVSDGKEIEPENPEAEIRVTVILPGIEKGQKVEVRHVTDEGEILLDSTNDGEVVTFTTNSFSLFTFTSTAQKIVSKTSEWLENTLFGRSSNQNATLETAKIDENSVPDGFSIIDTTSSPQNENLWLTLQRVKDIALGKLESISLYAVVDGKISALVKENVGITDILRLNLGNYSSFALVRDSGLRSKVEELGNVVLSGLMPKNGTAEAVDVTEEYENFVGGRSVDFIRETDEELDGEGSAKEREAVRTLAAYDISIKNDGEEYQPEDKPIEVTIKDEAIQTAIAAGKTLSLWHVLDDGTTERVENFTIDGDTVTFDATGFSVYVLTETIYTYYKTASGETYKISVEYDSTAKLPQNAALAVSEILPESADYDTYVAQSIDKLGVKEEAVTLSRVFDIKIVDENGVEREPEAPVKVSIQLVGEELNDYASVDVVHFGDQIDEMNIDVAGDTVEFTTDSFSVYVVDGSVYLRTYRFFTFDEYGDYTEYAFYTDSGETTFTQTIKNGEKPVAPQNPTNPQEPNAIFAGWFVGTKDSETGDLYFASSAYDFNNITEITANEEVQLYAKFSTYAYVVFHDQFDADTASFPVAYTCRVELSEGHGTIDTDDYSVSYHGDENDKVFTGWSEVPITIPGAQYNDRMEPIEKVDDTITVTDTIELYPIFTSVYWLTFYSGPAGTGATYYSDTYCLNGVGPRSLHGQDNMSRNGDYEFLGWYVSADGNPVVLENGEVTAETGVKIADSDGKLISGASGINIQVNHVADDGNNEAYDYLKLTGNVTIYALWKAQTTSTYSLIIRRQKATDDEDMSAEERSYEFAERFVLSGTIGEEISLSSIDQGYKDLETLNTYNSFHSDETINSDSQNPYYGYDYDAEASALYNGSNITISANGGATLILCYKWLNWPTAPEKVNNDYTLRFVDSQDTDSVYSTITLRYGTLLADHIPDDPTSSVSSTGFSFNGWYTDETCTTRILFTEDAFGAYSGNKVLYTTMPGANLTLYAGWKENRFLVQIDPNYGAMYTYENGQFSGTGATWFRSNYGELIQEYTTVTRDYVESDSGTWYYVNHAGNGNGGTDWNDRYTYYTQDPSEATVFTTFEHNPGVYRYEGWYEVNENTGEETPYDFSSIVDHDIKIKLHWTKVGAFRLQYDAGKGTLNDNEELEDIYVELEGSSYSDDAEVVVTRIATPPSGYEFVGWKIRGDQNEKIYYPGQAFTLLTDYAVTVQGKKTVYLDAVYTHVATASIVYDANGGTIEEANLDYGSPFDSSAPSTVRTCDVSAGTATISNLINNSRVYLSDGSGFSRENASFVGWSNKAVYDPDDSNAKLYLPGEQTEEVYNVDTEEPFVLYAVWQVSVSFHLNEETSSASFGGTWDSTIYTLNAAADIYTRNEYIGNKLDYPPYDPSYTGSGSLMFRNWRTEEINNNAASDNSTIYDFTQAVNGELDLYAYWAGTLSVTVHGVDASNETLVNMDNTWRTGSTAIEIDASAIALDSTTASSYISNTGYTFAFVAVHDSTGDSQMIFESEIATSIRYNSSDGLIYASYQNGMEAALGENDEIYFVYYQEKSLNIGYMEVSSNGVMSAVTASGAPSSTGTLGSYDVQASLTTPLDYATGNIFTHYAFAIGTTGNDPSMSIITATSDSDISRPALQISNTWRGIKYSTDGGNSWTSCGYNDIQLYVLYYSFEPIVVTLQANTFGLMDDMRKEFTFEVAVTQTAGGNTSSVSTTTYRLRHDESRAIPLLYTSDGTTETTQTVTITQTAETGFDTTIDADGFGTTLQPNLQWTYTTSSVSEAPMVVFTNTRSPATTVEVHVAMVNMANGEITIQDNFRTTTGADYSFDIPLGETAYFLEKLPFTSLYTGDSGYAFGTVMYGTSGTTDGDTITVGSMGVTSIVSELVSDQSRNIYEINLCDEDGHDLVELGDYQIYYLFYPMPLIRYMEETAGGVLTEIQGSTDGATATSTITYNGNALTMNGATVEQNQRLELPREGLIISQTVGSGLFNMPPLLDRGTDKLYLVYSKIGAGEPGKSNVSDIATSEDQLLYLQIRDNMLEWSFDNLTWTPFTAMPTVYAIYQERGYTLEITKTVPVDTGYDEPFTVTLSSTAINRTSYSVEGTGYNSVSAEPASGSEPGTIELQVKDGSDIRLIGLGSGEYTITETGNENYDLSVSVDDVSQAVTDNSTITLTLDAEKKVDLINTSQYICKIGYNKFHTISSAVQWIVDESVDFSGTIEMLVDYDMPSSDAPVIPSYCNITLKTSGDGDYTGSGSYAKITRKSSFTSGAMFSNSGALTLQGITLDGVNLAVDSAMLSNEGTLTIAGNASIINGNNSGNGGAVNSQNGAVIISGGNVANHKAELGSAVYSSDGTVTISGGSVSSNSSINGGAVYYCGTDTVTVSGGTVSSNTATSGGAIYLETGSLAVSGGTITGNIAENGGAVYAQNAIVTVSGSGTVQNNTAATSGGAVYLESGSMTMSRGTVSGNTATAGNGGAFWTNLGTITLSGGTITENKALQGNGGAIYSETGSVTATGGAISSNTAKEGGAVYTPSASVSISNANFTSNTASTGNGGAIHSGSGAVTLSKVTMTGNKATSGCGGALYSDSGIMTLSNNYNFSQNEAINGSAVYTNTGSATFAAGSITGNAASEGGAVGFGEITARLYFSGAVQIKENSMTSGETTVTSNVYLNQDTDTIINATGLNSSASVGIYVPGETEADLFQNRGVPSALFGTYTSDSNVSKFTNDRLTGVSVATITASKKLYWVKNLTAEVRYLVNFANGFPPTASGTTKYTNTSYNPPDGENGISEIADDLRNKNSNVGSTTAVFSCAFVDGATTFDEYLTDVNWDSEQSAWVFVKRDGSKVTATKIIVYFAEPSYITIENNTATSLTLNALTVLDQSAINSTGEDGTAGYGYVFAMDGVIQNDLRPITASNLVLAAGKTIKLLFPGGKNAAWTLNGSFEDAAGDVSYTSNGNGGTISSTDTQSFSLNGTTLNTNGGNYEIIFGGQRPICKIVTTEISGITNSEVAGKTDADTNGNVEYTFATLNDAVTFITSHTLTTATIEMLVDYLLPVGDVVNLPGGYNITFTTATTGTYKYSDDSSARATISRDQGNLSSFIMSINGALTSNDYNTSLKVENLIFDGKDYGGTSIERGIIRTKSCNVEISNVDFRNCQAQFGGGLYIESVTPKVNPLTPYGRLTVSGCRFDNCQSLKALDKYGGGAIWTSMKDVTISDCQFYSCYCIHQGGAIFHYLGGNYESSTTLTGCTFEGCSAGQAAGSMESGAKTVRITNTTFRNSTSNAKNGGALNIWALDNEKPTANCYVYLTGCTFENCYALNGTGTNGNGGAMRSTATHNFIENCIFINSKGNDGGAINIYSTESITTEIKHCTFQGCEARNRGGAVYCQSKELTVNNTTVISNCTAENNGGGIFHGRDSDKIEVKFTINDTVVENCKSNAAAGGGIYSMAKTVSATRLTVTNCTARTQGGGVYLYPKSATATRSVVLTDSVVDNCTSSGNGGGIYYERGNTMTMKGISKISGNTSGGAGGGIYTDASTITLTGITVSDNTAAGNGGGVCQNYNNASGNLIIDGCIITGNESGGQGGGIYTLASMTIRNDSTITGNRLSTDTATDAAGVYLTNSRTLTIGSADNTANDSSRVTGNTTLSGNPSNLRLPQKSASLTSDNAESSIKVLCHLNGEFRVIDAYSKGKQFGTSGLSSSQNPVYTNGFSDLFHVFIADDDSLYGIIDRSDSTLQKIIWAGDPICKITDDKGRLLFVDTEHQYPAVFDYLDKGTTNVDKSCAFGVLRSSTSLLYYAGGEQYTGTTYQVKMLVENYTANYKITTPTDINKTIILTTAGSTDSLYPYKGRIGTRSTVTRGTGMGNNIMLTTKTNLTLQNIVLDGGAEDGVTANSNTRIIDATSNAITVKLGRNAALQNTETTGNGGGVSLNNGASLIIEGGTIRNCSAANGGAVYKDGNGILTITGGTITRCTAATSGGGVFINKPQNNTTEAFVMSGGSISRCSATNGGGAWIANNCRMTMSGGNISNNTATTKGGGIAVGGTGSRLYFSGASYVYGNTSDASVADNGTCNVEMNQGFDVSKDNPGTVIYSRGMIRGAAIGVYVPGDDTGGSSTLYDKHGGVLDPFGTYDGSTAGLNYFINDRNGLKGGLLEGQDDANIKIYWRQIYSLEVKKLVLSDDPTDSEKEFSFTVTLSGQATGGTHAQEVNRTYGDMTFVNGVANITLKAGETKSADPMPSGFTYTVVENFSDEDKGHFKVAPGIEQTGEMTNLMQYVYRVTFANTHAVCKITDTNLGLLYYRKSDGTYAPAVYSLISTAFNRLKSVTEWYYTDGETYYSYPAGRTDYFQVEMLIPNYDMEYAAIFQEGTKAVLKTADPNADDGFPYVGTGTAQITRGYTGSSMITVKGALTLGDIILDGGSGNGCSATSDGGILNVTSGGSLTIDSRPTLQNSTTSANGAAIYLAEGSRLYISGSPSFSSNVSTGVSLDSATNGGESYTSARQDIYIAGYGNEDAASLYVTGNMTGSAGSIWVWAQNSLHYLQGMQFGILSGGTWSGLDVFRNARDDNETQNAQIGTHKWLYGVAGDDGQLYWYGCAEIPVTKTVIGSEGDLSKEFTFTIQTDPAVMSVTYTKNGTAGGSISGNGGTFTMKHGDTVALQGIPMYTNVTLTESNEEYVAWWDNNPNYQKSGTTGDSSTTFQALGGLTFNITNMLPVCKITDKNGDEHPFMKLNEARTWARSSANSSLLEKTGTATIEMLCNYTMPSTDTLNMDQANDSITLTTAASSGCTYKFRESEGPAIISRGTDIAAGSTMISVGQKNAIFTLNNITLDGNGSNKTATVVGAILRATAGNVYIQTGATLQNGKTSGNGGAIYAGGTDTALHIDGGTLQNNETTGNNGGAIFAENGAKISMTAGTIKNCKTPANNNKNGGAIYLNTSNNNITQIEMSGGTIDSCSSVNGGAIYANGNSTITLSGTASITNCSASASGGGVYLNGNNASLTISGSSSITSCVAATNGGGAFPNNGKVYISGGPTVSENTVGDVPNNIYITKASSIIQNGELTGNNPIGIYGDSNSPTLHLEEDQFGTRTDPATTTYGNVSNFKNDRDSNLCGVTSESIDQGANKLHWGVASMPIVAPTGFSTRHTPFLFLLLIGVLLLMGSGVAVKKRDRISDREPVNTGSAPQPWKSKHSKGDPITTDAEEHIRWRDIRKRGDAG